MNKEKKVNLKEVGIKEFKLGQACKTSNKTSCHDVEACWWPKRKSVLQENT